MKTKTTKRKVSYNISIHMHSEKENAIVIYIYIYIKMDKPRSLKIQGYKRYNNTETQTHQQWERIKTKPPTSIQQ